MTRRFIPIWLPILLIAIISAVNYYFWREETVGKPTIMLPMKTFHGQAIQLSRDKAVDPTSKACEWRVHVTPDALKHFGSIELAYTCTDSPPDENDWTRIPTGCTDSSFTASLEPLTPTPTKIWFRTGNQNAGDFWEL